MEKQRLTLEQYDKLVRELIELRRLRHSEHLMQFLDRDGDLRLAARISWINQRLGTLDPDQVLAEF